ncbi:hypothetical protein SCHPADRAFT_676128 [Schizopora paradoxa]|uniref:Uncharacterized protein n=1 Tax=Schizopora paradoxa TaxID=27342 RepID=A0A0H2RBE2_9AGAM|nr:hypothetical protein SCHPADRAFT_676128 [Schizopora paradoxa]
MLVRGRVGIEASESSVAGEEKLGERLTVSARAPIGCRQAMCFYSHEALYQPDFSGCVDEPPLNGLHVVQSTTKWIGWDEPRFIAFLSELRVLFPLPSFSSSSSASTNRTTHSRLFHLQCAF